MIQLALIDSDESSKRAIGARLRRATLHDDPLNADAVAFLNSSAETEGTLESGKPVLVAAGDADLTSERLRVMVQSKARLTIVNPDRYLPSRQLIRQQLDAGKLGEPGLIRVHRWGAAGNLLCDLDLVVWLFGKPTNLIFAIENEHCTQVHLGFPGGGMALLDHVQRLPAGDRYYSLSVIGSTGAAYADDHQNVQLVYQGGPARAVCTEEGVGTWAALLQDFVDAVASDSVRLDPTWEQVLTLHDAVAQSLRSKEAVPL